ncbi:cytochrome P450 89A2-like [Oryza brachyantha]|uniref:Cytochrome P450 n=1 Tax=Oryza brachyantha TaxID=4533 RepID=J3LVD6_ORYBR|nr:cytochrome P450 89A2-like [Oryza brachyantha]
MLLTVDMMLLPTLLVLTLFCLAVFRRTTRRARAPAALRQPTVEIHDAAVARRALIDYADAFLDRPAVLPFDDAALAGRRRSDNLTTVPYGPHWRVLRRNLTGGILHPSRVGLLAPLQHKAVDALVADIASRPAGEVLVREVVHDAVFPLVARLCFGEDIGERHVGDLTRVFEDFELDVAVKVFDGSTLARFVRWWQMRRFLASRRRQAEVFLPLIAARRAKQRRDDGALRRPYVDSLLDLRIPIGDDDADDAASGEGIEGAHSGRALTDDEMVGLVSEFLSGGTESVVACIEWTLAHLAIQPELQNKLRREVLDGDRGSTPPYLRAVILESLRMHPPVPLTMRDVRSAQALDDLSLPGGGARVHFILGSIGRDSNAWTDPDEFRPDRFMAGGEGEGVGPLPGPKEVKMMPFGAGRRFCPGMGLGMAHAVLFVGELVREFEWAPAASGGVDLTEVDGFFKMMRAPLRARATPRHDEPPRNT